MGLLPAADCFRFGHFAQNQIIGNLSFDSKLDLTGTGVVGTLSARQILRTYDRAQPPCRHRGDYEQHVGCNCPSGAVAAFECLLHEACCTLFKQSTDADVRHCLTCNDREERKAG